MPMAVPALLRVVRTALQRALACAFLQVDTPLHDPARQPSLSISRTTCSAPAHCAPGSKAASSKSLAAPGPVHSQHDPGPPRAEPSVKLAPAVRTHKLDSANAAPLLPTASSLTNASSSLLLTATSASWSHPSCRGSYCPSYRPSYRTSHCPSYHPSYCPTCHLSAWPSADATAPSGPCATSPPPKLVSTAPTTPNHAFPTSPVPPPLRTSPMASRRQCCRSLCQTWGTDGRWAAGSGEGLPAGGQKEQRGEDALENEDEGPPSPPGAAGAAGRGDASFLCLFPASGFSFSSCSTFSFSSEHGDMGGVGVARRTMIEEVASESSSQDVAPPSA